MNDNEIFRSPTRAEVNQIMQDAYRMRTQAMTDIFRFIGRGFSYVGRVLATLPGAFVEARAARAMYEELSRLGDRELADMGLNRGDIPAVVAGVFRRPDQTTQATPAIVATERTAPARDELPAAA